MHHQVADNMAMNKAQWTTAANEQWYSPYVFSIVTRRDLVTFPNLKFPMFSRYYFEIYESIQLP